MIKMEYHFQVALPCSQWPDLQQFTI